MTFLDFEVPDQSPPSIHCNFILSSLKDAFTQCHVFSVGKRLSPDSEDDTPASDIEDERVIVLAVRNWAVRAKLKPKDGLVRSNTIQWILPSSAIEALFAAPKGREEEQECMEASEGDGNESFYSVNSHFSLSSSTPPGVNGCLQGLQRQSLIEELSRCEGWPFGLYRKALMLPPLPRSPSESWSWCGGNPIVKSLNSTTS